jgi:hypothetical protein
LNTDRLPAVFGHLHRDPSSKAADYP